MPAGYAVNPGTTVGHRAGMRRFRRWPGLSFPEGKPVGFQVSAEEFTGPSARRAV